MDKIVLKNIIDYKLIQSGDNVVVGLSGGPDSVALLYSLIAAQKHMDFNLITAHVNHGVRGEDALADQLFVEKLAKLLKIKHYSKNVDMVQYGKDNGISAEEAGRELRYGFFREILKIHGGGKIAVAHNKNDQAETLLMRIMRGTGIDGLKGMEFKVRDIIRPILNVERSMIEKYISINNINTVLDKTNLMPIYSRNKVRLELIPYMEENFNPNLIQVLWRLSQISNLDASFLEEKSKEAYDTMLKFEHKDKVILDLNSLSKEHKSIQGRIIRLALESIALGLQGFSEQNIADINNLMTLGTGRSVNLPNDIIVSTSYDDLIFQKVKKEDFIDFNYKLELGHNEFTNISYTFNVELVHIDDINSFNMGRYTKCFDYDRIKGSIIIRNRKPGDRFQPFGMNGSKKLKDYFIDEKINNEIRKEIPLLIDDENILWVVGYRTSDLYKLTEETKNVLVVSVNP